MADPRHVDAARGNIGRNEQLYLSRPKRLERGGPLCLALVAVDRKGIDAGTLQVADDPVGAVFGAREDQRPVDILDTKDMVEQRLLFLLVDEGHLLADLFGGRRLRRDRNRDGIVQELLRKRRNFLGHRRREKEILPLPGKQLRHPAQRVDEAHVHHLIGLVEHENLDVVEAKRTLIDQVEQAARGCDEDVDALSKLANLLVDGYAAKNGHHAEFREAAVIAAALRNLCGQFARRRQHQHPAAARAARLRVIQHIVERRQRKGRCLAGTGLRDAAQVAAFHKDRDRLLLDRGRLGVALGRQRTLDVGVEAKVFEFHLV